LDKPPRNRFGSEHTPDRQSVRLKHQRGPQSNEGSDCRDHGRIKQGTTPQLDPSGSGG
jgi:hypothetical protein